MDGQGCCEGYLCDSPCSSFTDPQLFPDEPFDDLRAWAESLQKQRVRTVGDLSEQSTPDLERWGVPGSIATKLLNHCPSVM